MDETQQQLSAPKPDASNELSSGLGNESRRVSAPAENLPPAGKEVAAGGDDPIEEVSSDAEGDLETQPAALPTGAASASASAFARGSPQLQPASTALYNVSAAGPFGSRSSSMIDAVASTFSAAADRFGFRGVSSGGIMTLINIKPSLELGNHIVME